MHTPALSLRHIELSLKGHAGKVDILQDLSLDVAQGETVALVGPSGSGKSSALMVMGGLEKPTAGSLTVLGQRIDQMSENALARFRRGRVGVVFQSFHLLPTLSALDNVITALELAGVADPVVQAKLALDEVGLAARAQHYPHELSGGEQQRVAIARAIAPAPQILLADEPTGNLDSATGAQIIDLLFALQARHGQTLVMVTHAPDLAARCGRILQLRDGRLGNEA